MTTTFRQHPMSFLLWAFLAVLPACRVGSPRNTEPPREAELPRLDAVAAGFDPVRLGSVQDLLAKAVEEKKIAGAVALIIRGGKTAYVDAVGMQDAEASVRMQLDTIFRIASMTKPVTSVAAMMLHDEGKLQLTDPVSKFIPEFREQQVLVAGPKDASGKMAFTTVKAEREITIHDLLTHTSGITYGFFGREGISDLYRKEDVAEGLTQTEVVLPENARRIANLPLVCQPGSAWEYGLGTDVLGRVVEVASGRTLDQFFHERIFEPLRMNDTHFFLPREKVPRLAALYTQGQDRTIRRTGEEPVTLGALTYSSSFHYKGPRAYHSGGAGLVSTVKDYARFLQMILNRGELDGARILRPATVDLMCSNHITQDVKFPSHGDKFGYGFGVVTEKGKDQDPSSVGSVSWGGIFNTYFWADPKENLLGILMTQLYPAEGVTLRADFKALSYKARRE